MKLSHDDRPEIDDLLKKVFSDELPPEAEAQMAARFQEFRQAARAKAQPRSAPSLREHAARRRAIGSQILAFASVIMIVLGAAMHLGGSRSVLADSISATKTSISAAQQLLRARAMDCRAQVSGGPAPPAAWRIRWVSPDKTRIDISAADGMRRTYWLQGKVTAMSDDSRPAPIFLDPAQRPRDPLLSAVLPLVSPGEMARHLSAIWSLKRGGGPDGGEDRVLKYHDPESSADVDLGLDGRTLLPSQLTLRRQDQPGRGLDAAWTLKARFAWGMSIDPALMVPGPGAR
jgi:hypothetical protein